ncbi:MAG: flavin reductase family protein [Chlorobi bacterium]|nr:flavin reductase family protein [Chlorobiota bacterium]
MAKIEWKPGNMLYPLPVVMISCGTKPETHNIITVSWTGTINTDPPMVSISIRKERHSFKLIKEAGEFVINLTTKELAKAADWCGVKSGRDFDKFKEMKLTAAPASKIKTPLIAESPVNIECKITQVIELGTHHMFLAKVVAVNVEERFLDKQTNKFDLRQTDPITYLHGSYYTLGENLGRFGFSVRKKKGKRKDAEKEI